MDGLSSISAKIRYALPIDPDLLADQLPLAAQVSIHRAIYMKWAQSGLLRNGFPYHMQKSEN